MTTKGLVYTRLKAFLEDYVDGLDEGMSEGEAMIRFAWYLIDCATEYDPEEVRKDVEAIKRSIDNLL